MLFRQIRRLFCTSQKGPQQIFEEPFTLAPEETEKYQVYVAVEQYKYGMELLQQGKYRLALQFFNQFKSQLESSSMIQQKEWTEVNRRIIHTQIQLRKYEDAELTLEEIIRQYQKQKANHALIYSAYNDLFAHCLKYNLNKAILLGKALLSDKEKANIPPTYQKHFQYHLGTAYLLKENYVDAKAKLRECLSQDPSNKLKGWALNNLAVASWWHKFPNLREFVSDDEEEGPITSVNDYPEENIDQDFESVVPLLKKSIYYIENSKQVKMSMDWLLNDELLPADHKNKLANSNIVNQFSGKPLLNLSEFLFNKAPHKRIELQFWFKYTMKFYENQDPANMDRSLIFLAWMCSTNKYFERAEILYRNALQMLENTDNYNKVLCTQLLGSMLKKMPNRESEGEQLIIRALQMAETLPYWSNRLVHVIVPDFEI